MKYTPLLLLFLVFACSKNDPPVDNPLTLSANSLSLSGSAGSTNTFSVNTNGAWTATVSPDGILQLSPSSGTGTTNVTVTALQANTASSARNITITIRAGNSTQQLVVTQNQISQNWKNFLFGYSADEAIYKTILNPDGSMLHVGFVFGTGDGFPQFKGTRDMLLFKTDDQGKVLWSKTYGGEGEEFLYSCLRVDGGYLLAGYTTSTTGDFPPGKGSEDAILMKIDETGNIVWVKRFGGRDADTFFDLCQTADKKIYAVGRSGSLDGDLPISTVSKFWDIWVAKFDLNGNLLQSLVFGNKDADAGIDIEVNAANEIFVTGALGGSSYEVTDNFPLAAGSNDFVVMKLDPQGKMLWNSVAGSDSYDQGTALLPLDDGGVVVNILVNGQGFAGTNSLGGQDGVVVRYDKDGKLLWQKRMGGSGDDIVDNISKSGTDKFVVVGYSKSMIGNPSGTRSNFDGWIFQMNLSGVVEWQESYGGSADDYLYSIIPGPNNRIYFSGRSLSNDLPGTVFGGGGLADAWYGYLVR